MSHPPQTESRIVSKAEYVALMSKKLSLSVLGRGAIFIAWTGIIAVFVGFLGYMIAVGERNIFPPLIRGGVFLLTGIVCWWFYSLLLLLRQGGQRRVEEAKAMEQVIPLTRVNTTHLPASESLVRASSETVQEQQSILLRASIQSEQTPAEQLLRSAEE